MFDGNIVAGENIQNVPAETNFAVHLILVDVDDAEVLLASDTSNGIGAAIICIAFRNNHRTRSRWVIGIADVDRNTSGTNWEDGFFVEYRCTHVREFSQFGIGDGADADRIFYDSRVSNEETGNVCPVFIQVCASLLQQRLNQ